MVQVSSLVLRKIVAEITFAALRYGQILSLHTPYKHSVHPAIDATVDPGSYIPLNDVLPGHKAKVVLIEFVIVVRLTVHLAGGRGYQKIVMQ